MPTPVAQSAPDLATRLFDRSAPEPAAAARVWQGFEQLAQVVAEAAAPGPDATAALRALRAALEPALAALPRATCGC